MESSKNEVTSSSKSILLVRFFNLYIEIISSSPPLKLITFVSKFILNSLLNLLISTLLFIDDKVKKAIRKIVLIIKIQSIKFYFY